MTSYNRTATRREISYALFKALERRHAVLDVIVEAEDRLTAVDAIVAMLRTSRPAAEAVIGMSFDQLTKSSRREIAAELDDLNTQLSFTFKERPKSSGGSLSLRPFLGESDAEI